MQSMSDVARVAPSAVPGPEWVVAEMPPGYQTRVAEIHRLMSDLQEMGQFGSLLYQVGPELGEAVLRVFAAMKFEAEMMAGPVSSGVAVRLDAKRRLLLIPSAATDAIQKKGPELAQVFQVLHEVADEAVDRVALITNADPGTRPADRAAAITPDALAFLVRMGASHLQATTLFALWKLSLNDAALARAQVDRWYGQAAGPFQLSQAR